jgi:hypothetical protein
MGLLALPVSLARPQAADRCPAALPLGYAGVVHSQGRTIRTAIPVLLLSLACRAPTVGAPPPAIDDSAPTPLDSGEPERPDDTGGGVETIPDAEAPGAFLFANEEVHQLHISLEREAIAALGRDPTTYTEGAFEYGDQSWVVGVRLKGAVCFRTLSGKAAFKIKFNWTDSSPLFHGQKHLTLNNMVYDPSMMHETLAYRVYREAGLQAPRTGYARVWVNGEDYGLYLIVDTMDDVYIDQWWEDGSGPMYESGSYNYPCDVDDDVSCWELDEAGTDDSREQLQRLHQAATVRDPAEFQANMQELLDWDNFLASMATEVAISHWDSYSWNLNNFHVYHEPTLDKWYWSPWSTDLAFGWYPWAGTPRCGYYGVDPDDFTSGGYITQRCKADPSCHLAFLDALEAAADHLEQLDLPSILDATDAFIQAEVATDPRREYNDADYERDLECVRTYVTNRPTMLRDYIERKRAELGG